MGRGGCFDEFTTRRISFDRCEYWKRDEGVSDLSEYCKSKKPSGIFWAYRLSAETKTKSRIVNSFGVDANSITIRTEDAVDVEQGDYVRYDGRLWFAENVQRTDIHRQSQFMKSTSQATVIRLRG